MEESFGGKEENISVAVRSRPISETESSSGQIPVWRLLNDNTIISELSMLNSSPSLHLSAKPKGSPRRVSSPQSTKTKSTSDLFSSYTSPYATGAKFSKTGRTYSYAFDHLFHPNATNIHIYEKVCANIVFSAMEGINGTIFAYGQTASGKTFTMKGTGKRNPGLIPLAVQGVFSYIQQCPQREFLLRISYLEIYNEVINDLLAPQNVNLKIREDLRRGVFVDGIKEEIVVSPEQVMMVIAAGEAYRHVATTDYNEVSSRSHTIFRLIVESKQLGVSTSSLTPIRVSTLNLIDLAGSERASESVNRRKEGGYINKSLLTLGNVISKLSEKTNGAHIPYRDSKLTRILEPALAGNARIAIICTITLASGSFEETHNTLKFANRAKQITNRAHVNEIMDDKTLIARYRSEIEELKKKLALAEEAERKIKEMEQIQEQKQRVEEHNDLLVKKLHEQETLRAKLEEKIKHLTRLILNSTSVDPGLAKGKLSAKEPKGSPNLPRKRRDSLSHSDQAPPHRTESVDSATVESVNVSVQSDSQKLAMETLKRELQSRDSKLEMLRSTIEILNQNLKVLKEEVAWKDQQMRLMREELRAKDDRIDKLVTLKAGDEEQRAVLQLINSEKFAEEIRRLKAAVEESRLHEEVLRADTRLLAHQLEERDAFIKDSVELLEEMGQKMPHPQSQPQPQAQPTTQ